MGEREGGRGDVMGGGGGGIMGRASLIRGPCLPCTLACVPVVLGLSALLPVAFL